MSAVTECTEPQTCGCMFVFMLCQVGVAAIAYLTAAVRVSKLVLPSLIRHMTDIAELLIGTTIMRPGSSQ